MHLPSSSIVFVLCITSGTCQRFLGSNMKPETIIKNLTEFKIIEKIKNQILTGIGMTTRPTDAPDKPPIDVKSKAEVNEIISFSEPPDKFKDDKIIQFRFAKDIKGRRLIVKSASLLIRVKQKRRKRQHKSLKSLYRNSKRHSRRKKSRKGTRVSLSVSTVTDAGLPEENIADVKSRIKRNKWFKVSLNRSLMQNIVDSSNGTVLLYVQCKGCKRNTHVVLVHSKRRKRRQLHKQIRKATKSLKLNKGRPFLILHTFVETSEREKRSTGSQCWSMSNRCCKRQVYVNFREIGWDDWIISPRGFTTAECFGSCRRRNDHVTDNVTECAPTRMRTLRLIHQETTGVFVSSILPNFIVSKCGCGRSHTGSRERINSSQRSSDSD